MLEVKIRTKNQTIDLPPLKPGQQPAQLTDYTKKGTEIMVFLIRDDVEEAYLLISEAGFHVDLNPTMTFLSSSKLRKEATIKKGKSYEKTFVNKFGDKCILILKHT